MDGAALWETRDSGKEGMTVSNSERITPGQALRLGAIVAEQMFESDLTRAEAQEHIKKAKRFGSLTLKAARGELYTLKAAQKVLAQGQRPVAAPTEPTTITYEVTDEDRDDLPEGWELVEEESVREANGSITLEEYGCHEEGEEWGNGETILARSKEQGRLGLRAARALERQQHLIPAEWRGKTLVFAGTVALDRGRRRVVACLVWDGGRWLFSWDWLEDGWDRGSRLVRSRT